MTKHTISLFLPVAFLFVQCAASRRETGIVRTNPIVISIVATNDLHGHLSALPRLSGYFQVLRQNRQRDGGGVLVLDAGDMFQGTIESNTNEGRAVVQAYNLIGYDAVTIGNHEFDFGPVGPRSTVNNNEVNVTVPESDPQGALRSRAQEARFPFLMSNVLPENQGVSLQWQGFFPTTIVEREGVRIGIIGATTESTTVTTIRANLTGLRVVPVTEQVVHHARLLRNQGVHAVVLLSHLGGRCTRFEQPEDLSTCDRGAEVMTLLQQLPQGTVDAVVAGHTHSAMAHRIAGVPVIESYCCGRAFGRMDLTFDRRSRRLTNSRLFPPQNVCVSSGEEQPQDRAECVLPEYEGTQVREDSRVRESISEAMAQAQNVRAQPLNVRVLASTERGYDRESALGNLMADWARQARQADVGLLNAGGIRANFPEGELTYGTLYEAFPFDNMFATVRATTARLKAWIAHNLEAQGGIFLLSGVRVSAQCDHGQLRVDLFREGHNTPLADTEVLTITTSDFLVTGGDGAFAGLTPSDYTIDQTITIRDAMAAMLRARPQQTQIDPQQLFRSDRRRIVFPSNRPVRCS